MSPDFASMLAAADFMPPPQLAPEPKSEQVALAENSKAQQRVDGEAMDALKDYNVRQPSGEQGKMLQGMVDDIHAKIPQAIPEAKYLPPSPHILVYDSPEIDVKTFKNNGGDANTIAVSSGMLEKLSPAEVKGQIAHEMAGHELINANPNLQKNYVPPNAAHVNEDMQKLGITSDPQQAFRREKYMSEMVSDANAMRVTGDPAAIASGLKKLGADRQNQKIEADRASNESDISHLEKKIGHPLDPEIKASMMQNTRDAENKELEKFNNTMQPHPGDAVRIEAAEMTEKQQNKTPSKDSPLKDGVVKPLPTPSSQSQNSGASLPPR